jgi:hypothetical protein
MRLSKFFPVSVVKSDGQTHYQPPLLTVLFLFVEMLITPAQVKQPHPIANVSATNLADILRPFQ